MAPRWVATQLSGASRRRFAIPGSAADKGLFFGDIVNNRQVPNSVVPRDASYKGTIVAIKTMLDGPATPFIPGHGRSGGRDIPTATLGFLEDLYASVTKYYKLGLADYEMKDNIIRDMARCKDWENFNEIDRVISFVYREIEQDNF